ncbi:MAG: SPOR domain-containing protein [Planctomycetota bacterium]|nr:SPOR domain-containing protein [Planctomycetota bacterium]
MANGIVSPLFLRALTSVVLGAALLGLLPGCDNDRDEGAATASATARAPRPNALTQAISEIKGGKAADAQKRLEAFLAQEPKSAYGPEALYLLGQSLAAQGQYEAAKKTLDDAVGAADDRTLKALAMLGRADCNMAMKKFSLASRQYHWLETMYRDVKAIPQDELMYKLGLACKKAECPETADYWFKQVIENYATGPYAADAKLQHSKYTPTDPDVAPRVYTLEVNLFSDKQKAEAEAATLREKGYRDVQVLSTTRNSFPVYELHIGKFGNKSDAVRAQTDAELAGMSTTIRPAIIEPMK